MTKGETSKVNYIQHLLAVSEKFLNDDRLGALHISLYYALFHTWNMAKFKNPISIARQEIMRASKIGSANTYTRCLKELDAFNYIKYNPSYNPFQGSTVYLYKFNNGSDKGSDKGTDNGTDNGSDNSTDNSSGNGGVMVVIPYTNSLNNINNINSLKSVNSETEISLAQKNKNNFNSYEKNVEQKKDEMSKNRSSKNAGAKKVPRPISDFKENQQKETDLFIASESRFQRPLLQEVQHYFEQKKFESIEGQKFFNYYESNGWLVGGKAPMQNWQASADKWVLNANSFEANGVVSTKQVKQTIYKDYSEPL